jgi:hypothetical protein
MASVLAGSDGWTRFGEFGFADQRRPCRLASAQETPGIAATGRTRLTDRKTSLGQQRAHTGKRAGLLLLRWRWQRKPALHGFRSAPSRSADFAGTTLHGLFSGVTSCCFDALCSGTSSRACDRLSGNATWHGIACHSRVMDAAFPHPACTKTGASCRNWCPPMRNTACFCMGNRFLCTPSRSHGRSQTRGFTRSQTPRAPRLRQRRVGLRYAMSAPVRPPPTGEIRHSSPAPQCAFRRARRCAAHRRAFLPLLRACRPRWPEPGTVPWADAG